MGMWDLRYLRLPRPSVHVLVVHQPYLPKYAAYFMRQQQVVS